MLASIAPSARAVRAIAPPRDLFCAHSFSSSGQATGESGTVHGETSGATLKRGLCGGGAAGAGASALYALDALAAGDMIVLALIAPSGRRVEARRRTIGLLVFSWSSYRPSIAMVVGRFRLFLGLSLPGPL